MKGREGGRGEAKRVRAVGGAEGTELRVLLGDRVRGRGFVEEVPGEVTGERDERDPGVGRDRRDHLEKPREASARWRWRADDDGRLGLDDEALHAEGQGLGVAGREGSRAGDLPGVEGGVLDLALSWHEREDARVPSRRFAFEHEKSS